MIRIITIIALFLIVKVNFAQNIKATYSAELNKTIFNPDSIPNADYALMLAKMNWSSEMAIKEINIIVISDNNTYQVYSENPNYLQVSERIYDFAQGLITDGKFIHTELDKNKAYYVPNDLDFVRQVETTNINWIITDSSKVINGKEAVLAISKLKNIKNEYAKKVPKECWFFPEVKFQGGPTAYGTLPGLIAELNTDIINLKLEKIEYGEFEFKEFNIQNLKVKTHNEYEKYYEELNENHTPKDFR